MSDVAMVRMVPDDFSAMQMCNAMLLNGGVPISVCRADAGRGFTTETGTKGFHVFGRVPSVEKIERVDETYRRLMLGADLRAGMVEPA